MADPAASNIVKVDADTVKFTLNDTYAETVFLASLATVFICPEHIWETKITALEAADSSIEQYALEEESQATIAATLIGSGPFLFKEYEPLQYVLYETDDNYWGGTPAKVDEVMLKMYATADLATLALKAGDVDMLALVEAVAEVPKLLLDQNITIDIIPNFNSTVMFFLNMRFPPLHILEVRQAIDMALNKQDIITFAQFGYGSLPAMVPFAGGLAESNPDTMWVDQYVDSSGDQLPLATRITNANALLDSVVGMSDYVEGETRTWTSAGVDAFELKFEGLYLSSPSYQRAAELIADQMAKIGIEIVPTVETGAFGPKVFGGQVWNYETIIFGYPSDPSFDGVVKQWGMPVFGSNYDGSVVGWNHNPAEAPPGTAEGKTQTYDTPDWDTATTAEKALYLAIYNQLVADAADVNEDLLATRFIVDPVARLAAVYLVQEDFMDAMPIVTLYHPNSMSAYRTDGFEGWGNPEGVFLYGFMPGTTSVKTLMNLSPIE
jgi:ABC-type transport system substrate-binding protein